MSTLRMTGARQVARTARIASGFPPPPAHALKLVTAPPPATARCLNCDEELGGKFCQRCGQAAKTKRLAFHDFIHEVPHAVLHLDHALPHTVKALLTRPGSTIRAYLAGKRAGIYAPISLFFMFTGLFALARLATEGNPHLAAEGTAMIKSGAADLQIHGFDIAGAIAKMGSFLWSKQAYLNLLLLPANAGIPWLVLRKRTRLGFAEQVVTAAMIGTGMAAIGLVFAPAVFAVKAHPLLLNGVRLAAWPVVYGYAAWAYADLQEHDPNETAMAKVSRYARGAAAAVGLKFGAVLLILAVGLPMMYSGLVLKALASLIRD